MWGQFEELPGGALAAEPGGAVGADGPPGGVEVDDPLGGVVVEPFGASVAADADADDVVVVEVGLPVVALATAAPPPTATPAIATPAIVCRSRIFIASPPPVVHGARRGHSGSFLSLRSTSVRDAIPAVGLSDHSAPTP
jgi:hypothetical protein